MTAQLGDESPIEECLQHCHPPLPWIFEYAAIIENEDPAEMYTDPGVLARSLAGCAELFGLPAVTTSFDTTLEAEAMGCRIDESGSVTGCISSFEEAIAIDPEDVLSHDRIACVLDAIERLIGSITGTSVLGALTGPQCLVEHVLTGDVDEETTEEAWFVANDVQMDLANAYLDRGVDGLVVLEPDGPQETITYEDAIVPLQNLAEHFGIPTILVQEGVTEADIEQASAYGFDAICGSTTDPTSAAMVAENRDIVLGVGLSDKVFIGGGVNKALTDLPEGTIPTSTWKVPISASVEALHTLMGSHAGGMH